MRIAEKAMALLGALRREDIEALRPAERRRFADLCRHVSDMVEKAEAPRSGVLASLQSGHRVE